MVICAVGSRSPAKVKAVEDMFAALLPAERIVVHVIPQPSGVSDQPMGDEETIRGCKNRLEGLRGTDADFYIAFEGGLMGQETYEVFAYCAVALGSKYNEPHVSLARTGTFVLPPGLCERVRSGTELGIATDEEFGCSGGKETMGSIGILTRGRLTRKEYYAHALELALVPFLNAARYGLPANPLSAKEKAEGAKNMKDTLKTSIPVDGKTFDELKKEGNSLYMEKEFQRAVDLYTAAIKVLEAEHTDEPVEAEMRKALSVLYTNRAMANLSSCNVVLGDETFDPNNIPKKARPLAMKANADASTACDLDPQNGKAFVRKGQALLWLSALPQRAKEAISLLEQALKLNLAPSIEKEAEQWREYAKRRFDATTDMPDMDPSTCKQQ